MTLQYILPMEHHL